MTLVPFTFRDNTTELYHAEEVSSGSQGAIFLSQDEQHVVKLYYPHAGVDQVERTKRITALIADHNPTKGDPFWNEFFAWPDKLVVAPLLGYRMRFASGMRPMGNWIFPKAYYAMPPEERGWFLGRLASMIKLVSAAQRLSTTGISYPDFSHNNILVEPFTGRMSLIDCDSITIPNMLPAEVVGTPMYFAPELHTGQQREPSVTTDRHALATLLYVFLTGNHPLWGDKVHDPNDAANDDLLKHGRNALYIENPTDRSNHATGQVITAEHLGHDVASVFREAFVDGLHDPRKRPQPSDWLRVLTRVYDRVVPCETADCEWHSFVALPSGRMVCPACNHGLQGVRSLPFLYILPHRGTSNADDYDDIISRDKHYIVGWPGRTLHEWHTTANKPRPYNRALRHPADDSQATFLYDASNGNWYLKNLTLPALRYQDGQRQWHNLNAGMALPLASGLTLQFGLGTTFNRAKINLMTV